jgi:hypothetical protein
MVEQTSASTLGQERRRDTARRNARLQAQRTLDRLTQGIAGLAKANTPITAKTVEAHTGLSYRTITRNPEAYVLFCKHAAHFQPKPQTGSPRSTRTPGTRHRAKPRATAWDPLLGRPKRLLANRLRAAEQRLSELEQAFVASAVHEQELARRNLALETELAQTTRRLAHLVAEHRSGPA